MWIKRQVVMLPTNKKAVNKGQLVFGAGDYLFQSKECNDIGSLSAQQLHIVSNEKPKAGDWCYDKVLNVIFQIDETADFNHVNNSDSIKKVIATTDDSLKIRTFYEIEGNQEINLPTPSEGYVEAFVRAYNEGNVITEVMVEYDDEDTTKGYKNGQPVIKFNKLKIKPDNTITIRKVKDSWNREEVAELVYLAMKDRAYTTVAYWQEWIKENM